LLGSGAFVEAREGQEFAPERAVAGQGGTQQGTDLFPTLLEAAADAGLGSRGENVRLRPAHEVE
jgi:hypothetical protein